MARDRQRGTTKEYIPLGHEYRTLIVAILQRAMDDLREGGNDEFLQAHTWIVYRNEWFIRYCWLLGLDPERIREQIMCQYQQRVRDVRDTYRAKR